MKCLPPAYIQASLLHIEHLFICTYQNKYCLSLVYSSYYTGSCNKTCLQNALIWLQEMLTTLTLSPLWWAILISKYLIASCYVNDATHKYQSRHSLCANMLVFCGDSQFLSLDNLSILYRQGAKKEFRKPPHRRITLLNARVKCQHYHTLIIGCFISSFKNWGFSHNTLLVLVLGVLY